jgi:hypothetical protein
MKRSEILDTAKDYVTKDRASQHGSAENNLMDIAYFWSHHLDTTITSADVAIMMCMLKMVRAKSNPKNMDNFIDLCGYAALAGEVA